MRRLNLIFLLTVSFLSCFSQEKRDTVFFKSKNFTGYYSETKEQPLFVEYVVNHCTVGGASRKGMNFYKNDSIHTADNADYYKNVWDKGHLVPAASQNCTKQSIKETFSFLNCALQHQRLNQGVWKHLEEYERGLSLDFNVRIQVEVVFQTNQRLSTGALIPSGFYKTIFLDNKKVLKYYFPNKPPKYKNYNDYIIYAESGRNR